MKRLLIHFVFFILLYACGKLEAGNSSDGVSSNDHRIFVTSESYRGDFASSGDPVTLANAKCQELAKNAKLERTYVAIISTQGGVRSGISESAAGTRITITGDIYKVGASGAELIVASTDLWLTDSQNLLGAVNIDENGDTVNSSPWTGTGSDGSSLSSTCGDWADTSKSGWVGDSARFGTTWVESSYTQCGDSHPFYCISQ